MSSTLVLPTYLASELKTFAGLPVETGAVVLATVVKGSRGSLRLLAHTMVPVPERAYSRRDRDGLEITSEGFVPPLALAEERGSMAIWVHTHPGSGSSVGPSPHDDVVDAKLGEPFRIRTGNEFYGALIVSLDDSGQQLKFSGHVDDASGHARELDRILVSGSRISVIGAKDQDKIGIPPAFDRNVRAFGGAVQRSLNSLHIAVVGCGGTGSSVAEQLVRLGVRRFTLVDPEAVTETNLTRLYGSRASDVGFPKVEVVARHLKEVAPDAHVRAIQGMVTRESVAQQLVDVDVAFGCTDDNAGRLVLSRLSTYLMVPVIDCGVLLSSAPDGSLAGIDGRVTLMYPGAACMVCRGRIDLQRAAAEALSPDERARRVDEGYAPVLGRNEPAVVTYTTAVAAAAVSELLNSLIGYAPEPSSTEVLLRLHDREISTNIASPKPGHYCDPEADKIGRGATVPFLDQTWPT